MPIKFSELPVLIDTEEHKYFWANQLDVFLSSGMSDDLMSKKIGWC